MGPFQKIDSALLTAELKILKLSGPWSNICHPSGISSFLNVRVGAVSLKVYAQTPSTGK